MPEEINRILFDAISDQFVSGGVANLRGECLADRTIVGNVMIDTHCRRNHRVADSHTPGVQTDVARSDDASPCNADQPEVFAGL